MSEHFAQGGKQARRIGRNPVVSKVSEKTWHDSTETVGLFSGKADNRPCRTSGSRKTRLATHNGRIADRINTSDADILSLPFVQAGSRISIIPKSTARYFRVEEREKHTIRRVDLSNVSRCKCLVFIFSSGVK